jgi:hypothetical protein
MEQPRKMSTKQISDELDVLEQIWRDWRDNICTSPNPLMALRREDLEDEMASRVNAGRAT